MNHRYLVVVCHPVPSSFLRAAAEVAVESLRAGGHEVRVLDLDAEGFDPVLGAEEWREREHGVPTSLASHVEGLRWCTDLVLAYPTWFGGFPALLKGWFDRVWGKGVAWELDSDRTGGAKVPRPLLGNITRIWVVTTHGSTKALNALQGEAGRHFVRRTLRLTCSRFCRVRWVAFYGNDGASDDDRRAHLERVRTAFS
jgi:NAD(P)H dehydrogenase (quinone)